MNPLAAIYHPGGADSNGYPVSVIGFVTSWSETTGTVTQVVCVTTDGMLRTFDSGQIQIADRMVAALRRAGAKVIAMRPAKCA